ncbi:MAG: hypothetical protein FWC60_02075 [Firmicutes bacterium]|nr:hypothetical protein [Bacillota bacterium]
MQVAARQTIAPKATDLNNPLIIEHEPVVVEREIVINGLKIHLKSVFKPQTTLEKALENIIKRKISAPPVKLPA